MVGTLLACRGKVRVWPHSWSASLSPGCLINREFSFSTCQYVAVCGWRDVPALRPDQWRRSHYWVMNAGKVVGEGEPAFPKTCCHWLRAASCCYHPCPSPLTPEVSKRPAWIVCNLFHWPQWRVRVFFYCPGGEGWGEIRTTAPQLNHTKSSHKTDTERDVLCSCSHETVHMRWIPKLLYSESLKLITAGDEEVTLLHFHRVTSVIWNPAHQMQFFILL